MNKKSVLKLFQDDKDRTGHPDDVFTDEEMAEAKIEGPGTSKELQVITASELQLVLDDSEETEDSVEISAEEALFGPQTQAQSRQLKPTRKIPEWEKDMFPGESTV